jgi:hypothetical protein
MAIMMMLGTVNPKNWGVTKAKHRTNPPKIKYAL